MTDFAVGGNEGIGGKILVRFGDPVFSVAGGEYRVGGFLGLAAADVTGDGRLDLVAAVERPDRFVYLANTRNRQFGQSETFAVLPGQPRAGLSGLLEVVAGDFNGDGRFDLAGGYEDRTLGGRDDREVMLAMNQGGGRAGVVATCALPTRILHSITAGDLNGDRKTDPVVAVHNERNDQSTITVFPGR